MIDAGIMKPIELFKTRTWADEDMIADLQTLDESLQKNIAVLRWI